MLRLWLVAAVLATVTVAVDRSNFKTCSQSGFCARQRDHKPKDPDYVALLETLAVKPTGISVQLLNVRNHIRLIMELYAIQDNTARLRITELHPIRGRYEPPIGDVLIDHPKFDKVKLESRSSEEVRLAFPGSRVILQARPFRIDFVVDNEPVVSFNSRGLMKYEHYRKNANNEAAEGNEDQQQEGQNNEQEPEQEQEQEEPDMWEETFKTHKDAKPNGPSSVGIDVSFPGFEFVYGIPEHADTLALKTTTSGEPYRMYNLDVFEYELNNPMALYGTVPVMLAHNEDRTVGLFWPNTAEMWIDISSNVADKSTFNKLVGYVRGDTDIPQTDTHWFAESGVIDMFVMLGPKPTDVFKQYARLTGTTPLPPLFSIGYHQSRWNYNDEADVASVDAGFDQHNIPLDVIWLDIEHTDGKRYFTWDALKFPNSEEMIQNVSAKGRKMVTIVDPHIKRVGGYFIHEECQSKGHYIKDKDDKDYEGWCWPGSSCWPDFMNPDVREFWAEKFALSEYKGSTEDLYIWNDMNEPSVFNGPEITMHKDAKHYMGWEHREVHNIYGTQVHRATYEGLVKRSGGTERPFVLSRAFFAGSQRYGAVWTGDNTGEWGHLKMSLPMILTLNLVGITFSGADVGGFFKNPETELLTRWYQAAAYQPFFRAHAHLDTRRREPWLQPEENTAAIKQAIEARYRLLPYWYTLFYENEKDGYPVARPLWVEFPTVKEIFSVEDEYMVGSALLVRPVTDAGATSVPVYLPGAEDVWYDRDTWQKSAGGQVINVNVDLYKIPVYQRGGTIVPQKNRIRRSASLTLHDPYTLIVALDRRGKASGTLYTDDFHTFQYQKGDYIYRQLTFAGNKLTSSSLNPYRTSFTTEAWVERILIFGYSSQPTSVEISGLELTTSQLDFNYSEAYRMLTIRKPGVNIGKDFTITLK